MPNNIEIIVLGSGTSQGVPMIACKCPVCTSADPCDTRTNASILIKTADKNILIDCGKDFRHQAIKHDIKSVDHLLITHSHLDHIAGLDELRVFNKLQQGSIPVYGKAQHLDYLRDYTFHYLFAQGVQRGGGLSELELLPVSAPFIVEGIEFLPLRVFHGNMEIFGYKFLNCAYISDVSSIPEQTLALLYDLDLLIIDVLRFRLHPTHFNLEQGLALVEKLRPKQTYFTHICHDFSHQMLEEMLKDPASEYYTERAVNLAYDGLRI